MNIQNCSNKLKCQHEAKMKVPKRYKRGEADYYADSFNIGFLEWQCLWELTEKNSGEYFVRMVFRFDPGKKLSEEEKPWSISVKIADSIHSEDGEVDTNEQVFNVSTSSDQNGQTEYSYLIDEPKIGKVLSKDCTKLFFRFRMSVTKCNGLQNLISETIDMTEKFDQSNVVIELSRQKFYFVFETLALHSTLFYEKWMSVKEEEMPEDGYNVTLDESVDLEGFVEILKLLLFRNAKINCSNIQSILATAKQLKFEMVLAWCEAVLIKDDFKINRETKLYLAFHYDMSELQQKIFAEELREANTIPPGTLKCITAEKFNLPEMKTKFEHIGVFRVNTTGPLSLYNTIEAMFPWDFTLDSFRNGHQINFTLKPIFSEEDFKCQNYSILVDITLELNKTKRSLTKTFSPVKRKVTGNLRAQVEGTQITNVAFKVTIHIRNIKGLRYYIKPEMVRDFGRKDPSSTVILQAKEKTIFANLNLLASQSDYFKATKTYLNYLPFNEEHNLPMVNFEDMEAEELEKLLIMVYPSKYNETWSAAHLLKVIPMADRLLFPSIMQLIEERFINDKFPLGLKTLQIAIDYNMSTLKEKFLNSFKSAADIHKLRKEVHLSCLSQQAKLELFEIMMKLEGKWNGESPVYEPASPGSDSD